VLNGSHLTTILCRLFQLTSAIISALHNRYRNSYIGRSSARLHKFIHEASLSPHLDWSSLLFGQDSLSDEVIDHISTGKQYTMLEFSVLSAVPAQILIPCTYWHLHSVLPNYRLGLLLQLLSKVAQGLQDPSISTSSSYYQYSFVIDARVSCLNSFLASRRPMTSSESIMAFFSSN